MVNNKRENLLPVQPRSMGIIDSGTLEIEIADYKLCPGLRLDLNNKDPKADSLHRMTVHSIHCAFQETFLETGTHNVNVDAV